MFITLYDRIYSFFDPVDRFSVCLPEVIIEIFKRLSLSSLCRMAPVSRKFNQIQNMPIMWEIQADYFGIKLQKSLPYKPQFRNIELTNGWLDIFTKQIQFKKYLNDVEKQKLCIEVAKFMPPSYSVTVVSGQSCRKFTSSVDAKRKIYSSSVIYEDYRTLNPLERKSLF